MARNRREKFRDFRADVGSAAMEAGEDIVKTVSSWVVASWTLIVQFAKAVAEVLKGTTLESEIVWLYSGLDWFVPREGKIFFIVGLIGTILGWIVRFFRRLVQHQRERAST
jgi:hypothetical protein